jgi:Family of unknown function (DUF5990)
MNRQVTFRIVLESPPAGVAFGLQKGSGSIYETIQAQRSKGRDLTFEFSAEATSASPPDFRGPVVQGPRGQRFVYIDIGTMAGQADSPWTRRLKVPFRDITAAMIEQAVKGDRAIETRVPGTGRDGTPTCATVKPFDGWTVASA